MKDKLKKYLLPNLPYLFFVFLFDKLCQAVRLAPGLDASKKLLHIEQGFQMAFASSAPSFHALDICVGKKRVFLQPFKCCKNTRHGPSADNGFHKTMN